MTIQEKAFWALIALSSAGAAAFGYHRFKLIRPDLFEPTTTSKISEAERAARIAEYQKKGDRLSRAAGMHRAPGAGETCKDGFVVHADATAEPSRVIENGRPVRCTPEPQR